MIVTYAINIKDSLAFNQNFCLCRDSDRMILNHLLFQVLICVVQFWKNIYADGLEDIFKMCVVLYICTVSGGMVLDVVKILEEAHS